MSVYIWSTKLQKLIVLSLLIILAGCADRDFEDAKHLAREEFSDTFKKSMCMPWGRERQEALQDLVDISKSNILYEEIESGFIFDQIEEIDEQACLEAGYFVAGPLPIDLENLARRCLHPDISPPESFDREQAAKFLERQKSRRERCDQLMPVLEDAGYEVRFNTPDHLKTDLHRCRLADIQPPDWMTDKEAEVMRVRSEAWRALCRLSEFDLSLERSVRRLPR